MTMTHDALPALSTADIIDRLNDLGSALVAADLPWGAETVALAVDRLHELIQCLDAPVPNHPARTDDGDTATAAGRRHATSDVRRFSSKSRQARLLTAFENAGQNGLTALEAASQIAPRLTVSVIEGTRRRVSDLRAGGLIKDSGQRRKNTGSLDEATVYVLAAPALDALVSLRTTGWSK